jgi:hypothetical protein
MNNVRDIIIRLGRDRVITALGVTSSQISNKIKDNEFPAHWFDCLDKLAISDGWKLPRKFFSWKNNPATEKNDDKLKEDAA